MTELTDNLLQIFCVFICGCCSCISAIRNRSYNRLLVLLFYLSFGMGLAYWVLYLILLGTSPLVFCVSELMDGIVYFSYFTSLCRCTERKT